MGKLRSIDTVRTNCKVVQSYLGEETPINDITQAAVNDMAQRMLADKAAPATVNRKMQCLLALLKRERKAGGSWESCPSTAWPTRGTTHARSS